MIDASDKTLEIDAWIASLSDEDQQNLEQRREHANRARSSRAVDFENFAKERRFVLIVFTAPIFVALLIWALFRNLLPALASNIIYAIAATISIGIVALYYLDSGFQVPPRPPEYEIPDPAEYYWKWSQLVNERRNGQVSQLNEISTQTKVEPTEIKKDSQSIEAVAEQPFITQLSGTSRIVALRFDEARARLSSQIANLNRRGNVNLLIGIAISLTGMLVLVQFIYAQSHLFPADWQANHTEDQLMRSITLYMIAFLPRLSFVFIIELFAYFFLKLYKASLSEVKYFQNEITNMEAKHFALLVATEQQENATAISKVVDSMVETERNHILEKGQTTVDLEMARIERKSLSDTLKNVTATVDRLSKSVRGVDS